MAKKERKITTGGASESTVPIINAGRLPILVRIVLYRKRLEESLTFKSLNSATHGWAEDAVVPIAVWDNSHSAEEPRVNAPIQLIDWTHQPANTGLVEAYNAALEIAKRDGFPWMLLLDQDTNLTEEYLLSAVEAALTASPDVVAIVPKILVNGVQRSPNGHIFECPIGPIVCRAPGVSESLIYAINSGMLVRTEFLEKIGGYSADYRLDAVDHWFCREVYRRGKKIAVLPFEFEHGLSVYDKENYVSLSRFEGIMVAQSTFAHSASGLFSKLLYAAMLLLHSISQAIRRPGKGYASLAFREWLRFLKNWKNRR